MIQQYHRYDQVNLIDLIRRILNRNGWENTQARTDLSFLVSLYQNSNTNCNVLQPSNTNTIFLVCNSNCNRSKTNDLMLELHNQNRLQYKSITSHWDGPIPACNRCPLRRLKSMRYVVSRIKKERCNSNRLRKYNLHFDNVPGNSDFNF